MSFGKSLKKAVRKATQISGTVVTVGGYQAKGKGWFNKIPVAKNVNEFVATPSTARTITAAALAATATAGALGAFGGAAAIGEGGAALGVGEAGLTVAEFAGPVEMFGPTAATFEAAGGGITALGTAEAAAGGWSLSEMLKKAVPSATKSLVDKYTSGSVSGSAAGGSSGSTAKKGSLFSSPGSENGTTSQWTMIGIGGGLVLALIVIMLSNQRR